MSGPTSNGVGGNRRKVFVRIVVGLALATILAIVLAVVYVIGVMHNPVVGTADVVLRSSAFAERSTLDDFVGRMMFDFYGYEWRRFTLPEDRQRFSESGFAYLVDEVYGDALVDGGQISILIRADDTVVITRGSSFTAEDDAESAYLYDYVMRNTPEGVAFEGSIHSPEVKAMIEADPQRPERPGCAAFPVAFACD